jgi:acetyl-CoA carboxylase carboxyltransferase component
LLDAGSFVEIGLLSHSQHADLKGRTSADGMLTGSGKIDGRTVYVTADDGQFWPARVDALWERRISASAILF